MNREQQPVNNNAIQEERQADGHQPHTWLGRLQSTLDTLTSYQAELPPDQNASLIDLNRLIDEPRQRP